MKTIPVLALSVALGGLVHGQLFTFDVVLDGPSEALPEGTPPSPGTGQATIIYDSIAHTLALDVIFSGLVGTTTAAHIHAPTAVAGEGTVGVATTTPTFVGFPAGVSSGTYEATLDLTQASSYNGAFITANGGSPATAEVALFNAMLEGKAYLNIHSNEYPGGEIRGFLVAVPEPAETVALTGGLVGAFALLRRFRAQAG